MNGRRVSRPALAKWGRACFLDDKRQPCTVELSLYNPSESLVRGLSFWKESFVLLEVSSFVVRDRLCT